MLAPPILARPPIELSPWQQALRTEPDRASEVNYVLAYLVRARFDGLVGRCPGFREHPPSLAKFAIQLSSRRAELHVLGARFVSVVRGAPIADELSACAAATLGMPFTQAAKTSSRPFLEHWDGDFDVELEVGGAATPP